MQTINKFFRRWESDFKGSCLKQKTFTPLNRKGFFIIYELNTWLRGLNTYFILKDCLFGGVK